LLADVDRRIAEITVLMIPSIPFDVEEIRELLYVKRWNLDDVASFDRISTLLTGVVQGLLESSLWPGTDRKKNHSGIDSWKGMLVEFAFRVVLESGVNAGHDFVSFSCRTARIRRRRTEGVTDKTDAIRAVACIRFVRPAFTSVAL
jgi:hypothetical protein